MERHSGELISVQKAPRTSHGEEKWMSLKAQYRVAELSRLYKILSKLLGKRL